MKAKSVVLTSVACFLLSVFATGARAQCSYPAQEVLYQESVDGTLNVFVSCVTTLGGSFQTTNVSAATGEYPAGNSELTGYGVVPSQVNAVFEGTNGHLLEGSYVVNSGWTHVDLNAATGGEAAVTTSPLTSFDDSYGQHVFYIGIDLAVHQMYNNGSWQDQALTAANAVSSESKLASDWWESEEFVVYEGSGGHVRLLTFNGSSWSNTDLTAAAGGAGPMNGTPFAMISSGQSEAGELIYFLDTGGSIHEYYRPTLTGQWSGHVVTGLGTLLPISQTRLFTCTEAASGSEPVTYHVFYMTSGADATAVVDAYRPDNAYAWTPLNLTPTSGSIPQSIDFTSADGTVPLGGASYTTPQLVYLPTSPYPGIALLYPDGGTPPNHYDWAVDTLALPSSDNIVSPVVLFSWGP